MLGEFPEIAREEGRYCSSSETKGMQEQEQPVSAATDKSKRRIWSTSRIFKTLIVLDLLFVALMRILGGGEEDSTPLWFLDPLLSVSFLAGILAHERFRLRERIRLSRRQAAVAFVIISWAVGMLYELTISSGGNSFGGMHPKTVPSFIIAQGFYVTLPLLALVLIRRFHYTFQEVFFAAGLVSAWEVVALGIPMLLSGNIVFAPLLLAYYFVTYAMCLTWALIIVDEKLLWDRRDPKIPPWRKILYGLPLCVVTWLICAAWGTAVARLFNDFEGF